MRGNGSSTVPSISVQNVNNSWWESGLLDEIGEIEDRERGLFGGLDNNGVTAGKGRTKLPGS